MMEICSAQSRCRPRTSFQGDDRVTRRPRRPCSRDGARRCLHALLNLISPYQRAALPCTASPTAHRGGGLPPMRQQPEECDSAHMCRYYTVESSQMLRRCLLSCPVWSSRAVGHPRRRGGVKHVMEDGLRRPCIPLWLGKTEVGCKKCLRVRQDGCGSDALYAVMEDGGAQHTINGRRPVVAFY